MEVWGPGKQWIGKKTSTSQREDDILICFDFIKWGEGGTLWFSRSLLFVSRIPLADFHDSTQGNVGRMWNCRCQWWISSSVKVPVTGLAGTIISKPCCTSPESRRWMINQSAIISHISPLAATPLLQLRHQSWIYHWLAGMKLRVQWFHCLRHPLCLFENRQVTNIHWSDDHLIREWCECLPTFSNSTSSRDQRGTRRLASQGVLRHQSGPSHRYPHQKHIGTWQQNATNTGHVTASFGQFLPWSPCRNMSQYVTMLSSCHLKKKKIKNP